MNTFWLVGTANSVSLGSKLPGAIGSLAGQDDQEITDISSSRIKSAHQDTITSFRDQDIPKVTAKPGKKALIMARQGPLKEPPSMQEIEQIFAGRRGGSPTIVQLTEGVHF